VKGNVSYNYCTSASSDFSENVHCLEPGKNKNETVLGDKKKKGVQLSQERTNPRLRNPDYITLKVRAAHIKKWLEEYLPGSQLDVLDVGGRIQPYRKYIQGRVNNYVAIDPQAEGMVDLIGYGENLPFKDFCFDVVICTQVLGYTRDPFSVVREMHRVLKKGGLLILSAPAWFPMHHDEHWRFLSSGLQLLLQPFSEIEVSPDGYSIAGLFRTISVCINNYVTGPVIRRMFIPTICIVNKLGFTLDRFSRGNEQLTANFTARAIK